MASEEFLLVEDREVVLTEAMSVVCDGGNGALGHPREFMTLEKDGEAVCNYCGRRYVHLGHAEVAAIRAASRPFAA
ncbi:MAG: zinc-finger domain-containing protein [Geminicoccaceae bacterium]